MITWIIGSGGLLGSALTRQTHGRLYRPGPIPWHDPALASRTLHQQARDFEEHTQGQSWRVIWAAGAATTATPAEEAQKELRPLEGLVTGLRSALPGTPGSFVLTSSAGGVYAGAENPPFTTATRPATLSPYGELKLAQEELTTRHLNGLTDVVIGRVSNLYGPGQNLAKLQGLISHLARAAITRHPVNVFVPLDTTRDYIFADDAALALLALSSSSGSVPQARTHIVATGHGTTIGQLIRTITQLAKRRIPVALGTHPSSSAQAVDLRLIPSHPLPAVTPLPVGIHSVYRDLLERAQEASVVANRTRVS